MKDTMAAIAQRADGLFRLLDSIKSLEPHNRNTGYIKRQWRIPCTLSGRPVSAFPDSGSSLNLLSESLASKFHLQITTTNRKHVELPDGKEISTLGTVSVPFLFKNESTSYPLIFHVMKDCAHHCILGKKFLEDTKTLGENCAKRVKETIVSARSRLKCYLVDAPKERLMGKINGIPIGGLPDTGANANIMSRATAEGLDLKILKGKSHTNRVRFIDRSSSSTSGTVYGVKWKFGTGDGLTHTLDIHILDDLPCGVVLCDDILFENNAFMAYEEHFVGRDAKGLNLDGSDFIGFIDVGVPFGSVQNADTIENDHQFIGGAEDPQLVQARVEGQQLQQTGQSQDQGGSTAGSSNVPSHSAQVEHSAAAEATPQHRRRRLWILRRFWVFRRRGRYRQLDAAEEDHG